MLDESRVQVRGYLHVGAHLRWVGMQKLKARVRHRGNILTSTLSNWQVVNLTQPAVCKDVIKRLFEIGVNQRHL